MADSFLTTVTQEIYCPLYLLELYDDVCKRKPFVPVLLRFNSGLVPVSIAFKVNCNIDKTLFT
jgi:hypothetical protein